tara:strand:+ start:208 stop:735 length:528 start_codon:yes stop_codon:yes gene_type:complete
MRPINVMIPFPRILCLGLLAGVGFLGCEKAKQIKVYTIPAEPAPPASWGFASPSGPEKARFTITDTNGTASVSMTVLQGDGGGLLENVNRWRGQLGLEKLEEKTLADVANPVKGLSKEARMIDITGISQRTQIESRLVGVIVSSKELTWFYKLMGSPPVVEEAKEGFLDYLPQWR